MLSHSSDDGCAECLFPCFLPSLADATLRRRKKGALPAALRFAMSAMDTSDNAGAADAAAASAASPAAPAPAPTEAASSSTAAAAASSSAAAAAASPSATAGGESDDDDIVVNEKDLTEDAITGGEGAPPPGPKKRRGRPAAAAADATPRVIGADALERLNELLRRTEQFAKFVPSDSAKKGGKGKSSGGRHHERAEEEAEDKELVADELQQAEVKNNWPDHLDQQPTSVVKDKGLPMRDYQLEALNWYRQHSAQSARARLRFGLSVRGSALTPFLASWLCAPRLIKLHDQNLNGILADEMGLGQNNRERTPMLSAVFVSNAL